MYRKKQLYIVFGAVHNFRHALGVLEQIRVDYRCLIHSISKEHEMHIITPSQMRTLENQ